MLLLSFTECEKLLRSDSLESSHETKLTITTIHLKQYNKDVCQWRGQTLTKDHQKNKLETLKLSGGMLYPKY